MGERRGPDDVLREEGLPAEGTPTGDGPGGEAAPDRVEEADRESFPASDPPGWAGGREREEIADEAVPDQGTRGAG